MDKSVSMIDQVITGGLAVAALLFIWFNTSMCFRILRLIPKRIQGDWYHQVFDETDRKYMTRNKYIESMVANSSLHHRFIELIHCPICLGTWISVGVWSLWWAAGCFESLSWLQWSFYSPIIIFSQLGFALLVFFSCHEKSS